MEVGHGPQSIPAAPVTKGLTDREGKFPLGTKPFGEINSIGLNGTLLFALEARGHREHRFLDICHFVIAKARGARQLPVEKSWTAELRTGIPPPGAPEPPRNLRFARLAAAPKPALVLAWDASPSPAVTAYNVYEQRTYGKERRPCDLSVTFDIPYVKIATVQARSPDQASFEIAVEPLLGYAGANEHPWFTVTAAGEQGLESAWARNKELTSWGPFGNATVERPDASLVKVTLPAGAAWIQARRSFVAGKSVRLSFHVKTESKSPSSLRLNVAGLGEVDVLVTGGEQGKPVIGIAGEIADGKWHVITIALRPALDALASELKVSPAQAQTTWNEDWLVTECRFGRWSAGEEVFWFRGLQVK